MKFGIDTRIYNHLDVINALNRLYLRNVKVIELSTRHVREIINKDLTCKVSKLVKDLNLNIIQIHAPQEEYENELAALDSNVRDKCIEKFKRWLELCYKVECEVLVTHLPYSKALPNEDTLNYTLRLEKCSLDAVEKIARMAMNFNVEIAIENRLESVFGSKPQDLVKILKKCSTDNVGICVDTGHARVNGYEPAEFIEVVSNYIIATHIHDNDGEEDKHYPPFMGCINWDKVLKVLAEINYSRGFILEVSSISENTSDNIVTYCNLVLEYFRNVLAKFK